MSYAKAMKHARNVRKSRKQARMYFGFDSFSGPTRAAAASPILGPLMNIRHWFRERRFDRPGSPAYRHRRECIHEAVMDYRAATAARTESRPG
ncbi:MAG TPA: hypothetical protein VF178_04195 [Gemmatimonadaceae bacterium]